MRLAIISDIHGNYEAYQQVMVDIGKCHVDAVISLGDNIGYGPEPELVIQQIKALNIPSVLGNHELAVIDKEYLNWFNPAARKSLAKTCALLSKQSLHFISQLEPFLVSHDCRFVHGFPPDSPLIYLFQMSDHKKMQVFEDIEERICFVGHTHTLEIISYDGYHVGCEDLSEGITRLKVESKYFINVGSIGQPRDDTNDAKYVIWDSSANSIEVRFVTYDIAAVVRKIKSAGLPKEHAQRLW
jgi:predicted phosphodiesterase